ncbi:MAG: anthrone oxygenase family protein [Acidimicrobiales bacterium]
MALDISEVVSIVLLALVGGLYWGPWIALTRTMAVLSPEVLIVVVKRMSQNMAPIMTALMPLALLSGVPVLILSFDIYPHTFWLTLAALALFVVTFIVTVVVEVPIVTKIDSWTPATLPEDWERLRDRWGSFHLLRVVPAIAGLVLLVVGAIR